MTAEILSISSTDGYSEQVRRAAETLAGGGIVVLPTETVYGAAASLAHPAALRRLREATVPPESRPLVIHLARPDEAARYVGPLGRVMERAIRRLWPGPVALVFDVPQEILRKVAGEFSMEPGEIYDGDRITLRCPENQLAADVIAAATADQSRGARGNAIVVRRAGGAADRIDPLWHERADVILDAGPTRYSKPSTVVHIRPDGYDILRPGVYDARTIERVMKTTILYICSGNTCRSPMAEALTRALLALKLGVPEADLEKKGINVVSAGAFAFPGARATEAAAVAVKELGGDLSRHRSRQLTVELINQADMIYTMGRAHLKLVTTMSPTAASKSATLDPDGDIEDPIGGDVSLYLALAKDLRKLIEKRVGEMRIV